MKLSHLLVLALLAPLGFALTQELRVEPDQNNVTAGRLVGTWESDPVVAERLGLEVRKQSYEFREGDEFLDQIPAKIAKAIEDFRIFESGVVVIREGGKVSWNSPYLLTEVSGNPHCLVFRERGGDPLGDVESFNLFVAQGKERANDLLLIGGDFNNEPFRPLRRVKDDK